MHPRTGILLVNRARVIAGRKRKQLRVEQAVAGEQHRQLPADTQWHRIDGLWYEVKLCRLDGSVPELPSFDILLKRAVTAVDDERLNVATT